MAGLSGVITNFNLLPINMFFLNRSDLARLNPGLFSWEGQFTILLWGAAYYAAGCDDTRGPIWLVFAAEKAFYVLSWAKWHMNHDGVGLLTKAVKRAVETKDPRGVASPLFHCGYGIVDAVFIVIFVNVWLDRK